MTTNERSGRCRGDAAGRTLASKEGTERIPNNQRGGRRTAYSAARPALLGDEVSAGEAVEAGRRATLLSSGRHCAAAADFRSAVHSGIYHQRRAAPATRGRRQTVRRYPPGARGRTRGSRGRAGRQGGGGTRTAYAGVGAHRSAAGRSRQHAPQGRSGSRAAAGG